MASEKLKSMLNEAIARELQVIIQYVWQHVTARGLDSEQVGAVFRLTAMSEMKHAELIAERLDYLGGELTTKPNPIEVGTELTEMLRIDKKAEEDAIQFYKEIILQARGEMDFVTARLFEDILVEEEAHHDKFMTLLGE